jgi:hypothetical protein
MTVLSVAALAHTLVFEALPEAPPIEEGAEDPFYGYGYYGPYGPYGYGEELEPSERGGLSALMLPSIAALAKIWVGWILVAVGLLLILTLMGGSIAQSSVLVLVAWAGMPFALRDVVRMVYMSASGEMIQFPGLSGFAPMGAGLPLIAARELLKMIDVYWLGHVLLLLLGVRAKANLGTGKRAVAVLIVQVIALGAQIIPGLIRYQLSGISFMQGMWY